jgi:hypothetical protein
MVKNAPLISVLTPIWNRPSHLCDFLQAMAKQNYLKFELLVHDDGSDEPYIEWINDAIDELGTAANLRMFFKHERRRKPDDPDGHPGYAQWAKMYNTMVRESRGDIVGILSSDWVPEPDFLSVIAKSLQELGLGNMVFGDVPEQLATKSFIPQGMTTGHYRVDNGYCADTRNQNFLWRKDWHMWDESFDDYGFGHAMPFWLGTMFMSGVHFWLSLDMRADENQHDNPPEFTDQILSSTPYFDKRARDLAAQVTGISTK